ncbi:MAG TPA: DUF4835 family protein [Candidatus Marinimicrobia bacterium]|nr:DUF4835 family protein [Candidatus Neomarinimicrobiota bacterium]|tara:strand:+ start:4536 stop:5378 length:843 start_codon:yes stop_codon:yes gene_type:complete
MLEKLNKYIVLFSFFSLLNAQFKEAFVSFDDRLLKADEKTSLFQLQNNIKQFYEYTVWNEEYRDLEININIQLLFEGNANIGSTQSYGIQSLFSNNTDLHFFDKGSSFILSQNNALYYDSVYFDPLSSLLGFYGNIILGAELDTWSNLGGSSHYEKARSIAVRSNASNFSRGWDQRIVLINLLTENVGLRKLRFSTYLTYELFDNGEIDACGEALNSVVENLTEVVDNYNQENYTNTFLKFHGKKIGEIMQKLGQKELLREMIYLDSQRDNIYKDLLSSI